MIEERSTSEVSHLTTLDLRKFLLEFDADCLQSGEFNECMPIGREVFRFIEAKLKGENLKPKARNWDKDWFKETKLLK